jgi:hypothetical protein
MISPDRTDTRIVPSEQQGDAATAGWEHASKMIHPATQDKRWVPASQISDAMKSGYVNADTPAASTSKPGEQFQGLGSAAKETAQGLVTGGGLNPVSLAKNAYQGITEDIPAVYKAYEAARSTGASVMDAYHTANAKAQEIQNAKNGLIQAVKEFNTNPNKAAWNAVLQLGTVALGGKAMEAPEAEMATAQAVAPEAAAEAAAEPGVIEQVWKGEKVAQPQAEAALRKATQNATPVEEAAPIVEDKYPVKIVRNPAGDILDLDGRHRVMQAVERGDDRIGVQTTMRDGSVQNINVDPKLVAKEFGVTKESLAATDATQPYRAAGSQPRPAVTKPGVSKPAAQVAPAELRESLTAPIEAAEKGADALYKTIDDATGNTDIKGLGKKLRDTNFKIRMSTNPTDEAAWELKRTNIQDTIADALKQAKDAGVPDDQLAQADAQFKGMSALTDVEKRVFKNVNVVDPTTGEVNVNAAVKELQKLQDNTKYGSPRLEQAFGKGNTILEDMKAANRLGIKALNRQQLAKTLLKSLGVSGVGYEVLKQVTK